MQNYKYNAVSKSGEKVSGVIEAFNEFDAVDRIKQTCDIVLKVQAIDEKQKGKGLLSMEIGSKKLNSKAFTMMCSQFSIILHAGVSIVRTVNLISKKITDKELKRILTEVADDVAGGRSLTTSFEERGGKLLPVLFIETLRAGEMSGNIDEAFKSMAEHYDKQAKIKNKVKGALIYPIFVLIIAIVVVFILMVKVVPTFTAIFISYGSDLPAITKVLIAMSDFFKNYGLALIGVIIAIIIFLKIYAKTDEGKIKCAKATLKLPVVGNISSLNAASQFANNMGTLIRAGLSITKSVRVTSKILSNAYIGAEVGKIAGKLEEGNSLGDCLRQTDILPDILVDMIAVGEETGELDDTLDTVALYYDSELEVTIASTLAKLEPSLLVAVAGIAGFIVIAIYVTMFQMYGIM